MNVWALTIEALAALAVLGVAGACINAALVREEGPAGGAVRLLATLLLPALALSFTHLFFWAPALGVSLIAAAMQWASGERRWALAVKASWWLLPAALTLVLVALKAALAIGSAPYDIDSIGYHVPMSIAYVQHHTAVPAQVMFHPGNAELLDALGLGALGAVGGQTLTEIIVALALTLAAFGAASELGARRRVALAAAAAVTAIPLIADQLLTAQNDVLVATLLLAFVALWRRFPTLAALALGMAAGTKFTGAVEGVAMAAVLWKLRSPALSWRHALLAAVVGAPWYVRNLIETGNPFYLGAQTSGVSSTIAGHLIAASPYVLAAFRNYGGLVAVLGVAAVAYLARRDRGPASLAPYVPAMMITVIAVWFVTPNSAEGVPGTLDFIRPGWSLRYVLIVPALLTIAAIIALDRLRPELALATACLTVLATALREYHAALQIDAGAMVFVLPACAALALGAAALATPRFAPALGLAALAVCAGAAMANVGAARIASTWDARLPLALAVAPGLQRVATIVALPLAVIGPRFAREDLADENGLPPPAWWRALAAERPQAVYATDIPHTDPPQRGADEAFLVASGRYREAYRTGDVRVYVPLTRRPPHAAQRESLRRSAPS